MKRTGGLVFCALLLGASLGAQTVAETARATKQKRLPAAPRKIWTNDDFAAPGAGPGAAPEGPPSLAPFVPSPLFVVRRMLEVAKVRPNEVVLDVGSGDGRIVLLAAEEFGAWGVGIELNAELAAQSCRAAEARGLADRVRILEGNALEADLSGADVVTLYLTPDGMELLRPHLERTLRPGTRVVSNLFPIPGWTPAPGSRHAEEEIWLYVRR